MRKEWELEEGMRVIEGMDKHTPEKLILIQN